jgi:hypothetical protein
VIRVASKLLLIVLGATGMVVWMPPAARPAAADIVTVDGGSGGRPDVGLHTSLELDAAGNPVISYGDNHPASSLKLAHCNDPYCIGGDESIVTVDGGPGRNVGWYTSLELDVLGNPVISYWNAGHSDLMLAHCNDPNCAGGDESIVTVDAEGDVGRYTSLELTSGGLVTQVGIPVIAYYDASNRDLKVTQCGDVNCQDGGLRTAVDTGGDVGTYASLELGAGPFGEEIAFISYHDNTNGDLKLAMCAAFIADCGGMTAAAIDTAGQTGLYTSLSLLNLGFFSLDLTISYWDATNGDLKVADLSSSLPGDGVEVTVIDSVGEVGRFSSISRNAAGQSVIAYADTTNTNLKIATCGGALCAGSAPTIATVASAGRVGTYSSAQFDAAAGRVLVSYYDATNGDLKLLTDDSPTGAFEPIASPQPAAVDEIDVIFSEPVTGVEVDDFHLTRDGVEVELDGVEIVTEDGVTWTLTGLGPLTTADPQGDGYMLEMLDGHGIFDAIRNPLTGTLPALSFWVDPLPSVDILPIGVERKSIPLTQFEVLFSEPVTGFGPEDIEAFRGDTPLTTENVLDVTEYGGLYVVTSVDALMTEDGVYRFVISDGVGDSSGQGVADGGGDEVTVTLDTTGPVPAITLTPPTPGGANGWHTAPVGVDVAAADLDTEELRCALDPAAPPAGFDALPAGPCLIEPVGNDGGHIVYAAAMDDLGNHGAVVSSAFRIDLTAPTTAITLDPAAPDGSDGEYASAVTVAVAADDEAATVRCVLDPAAAPTVFDELPEGECAIGTVVDEGEHNVYAASVDEAGNIGALAEATFDIDLPVTTDPPEGTLELTVSDPTPQPGQTITLSATGFEAGETVEVVLYSDPRSLATATTDGSGDLKSDATIPADTTPGTHVVAVYGDEDVATATIEVTAAPAPTPGGSGAASKSGPTTSGGSLALTGATIATYAGAGAAAILAGALLVGGSRRRRTA